jgi:hypothetical protein
LTRDPVESMNVWANFRYVSNFAAYGVKEKFQNLFNEYGPLWYASLTSLINYFLMEKQANAIYVLCSKGTESFQIPTISSLKTKLKALATKPQNHSKCFKQSGW